MDYTGNNRAIAIYEVIPCHTDIEFDNFCVRVTSKKRKGNAVYLTLEVIKDGETQGFNNPWVIVNPPVSVVTDVMINDQEVLQVNPLNAFIDVLKQVVS